MPESEPNLPERRFGWWDMWVAPEDDPRSQDFPANTERAVLTDVLRNYRLTLELKCADLDADQLARRSVPPSNLSLLGLVRHLAGVEQEWFRIWMAGEQGPRHYRSAEDPNGDFDGALADPDVVADAWATWRSEVAYAEAYVDRTEDLGHVGANGDPLRAILVHAIEEYARHLGHADLIRERIDGRVGQ